MTIEQPLTVDYVRDHPTEWSITVTRGDEGLVKFTVVRNLQEPRYFVAHLAVQHAGKLIAKSDSPAFGKKQGNTFYFAVAEEDLADSKFELSESAFTDFGDHAVPEPGTIIHQIPLKAFFAASMSEPESGAVPDKKPADQSSSQAAKNKLAANALNDLIEKALTAHGGKDKLKALQAFTLKLRDDKPAGSAGVTEYSAQLPDKLRIDFSREDRGDKEIQIILGLGSIHRWHKSADGKIVPISLGGRDLQSEYWLDYLKYLGPRAVLRLVDPEQRLTLLDDAPIEGRPAACVGVAMSAPGVTVSLKMYFDKESGLLIAQEDAIQKFTTLFRDYKSFNGIMVAGTIVEIRTADVGRRAVISSKFKLAEFKPVDKFDAKLFEQP